MSSLCHYWAYKQKVMIRHASCSIPFTAVLHFLILIVTYGFIFYMRMYFSGPQKNTFMFLTANQWNCEVSAWTWWTNCLAACKTYTAIAWVRVKLAMWQLQHRCYYRVTSKICIHRSICLTLQCLWFVAMKATKCHGKFREFCSFEGRL